MRISDELVAVLYTEVPPSTLKFVALPNRITFYKDVAHA